MLRLYENSVQFYIRDLSICGFLFRSVGCQWQQACMDTGGGGGGIVFFVPPPQQAAV